MAYQYSDRLTLALPPNHNYSTSSILESLVDE